MMYYHIYLYHGSKYNYYCVITQTLQNGQTLGQFFELLYQSALGIGIRNGVIIKTWQLITQLNIICILLQDVYSIIQHCPMSNHRVPQQMSDRVEQTEFQFHNCFLHSSTNLWYASVQLHSQSIQAI